MAAISAPGRVWQQARIWPRRARLPLWQVGPHEAAKFFPLAPVRPTEALPARYCWRRIWPGRCRTRSRPVGEIYCMSLSWIPQCFGMGPKRKRPGEPPGLKLITYFQRCQYIRGQREADIDYADCRLQADILPDFMSRSSSKPIF